MLYFVFISFFFVEDMLLSYLPCYDIWLNVFTVGLWCHVLVKAFKYVYCLIHEYFQSLEWFLWSGVRCTVYSVTWLVHMGQPTLLRWSILLSCKITWWRSLNWNVIIKMYSWSQVKWRVFFFSFWALWITLSSLELVRPGWYDKTNPITLITNVF